MAVAHPASAVAAGPLENIIDIIDEFRVSDTSCGRCETEVRDADPAARAGTGQ